MKIAIVGCGAMGSVFGGLLADAGNDVLLVGRNAEHIRTINACGLRVEGASGDRIVQARATTTVVAEPMDLVVLAVKATQVRDVCAQAKLLLGPDTVVLAMQNGLGSAEIIAQALGEEHVAVGIAAGFGAALRGPGHVYHNGMDAIRIGGYTTLDPKRVEQVATAWRGAGFNAKAVPDILAMQWEKLICNVAYSAPCAVTGLTIGQVISDPDIGPISRAAATEAWRIAMSAGIAIAVPDPVAHVLEFGTRIPNAKPSMLIDHELSRASEVDFINGAIPKEAARVGLEAPVNTTLVGMAKFRERAFARGGENR